MILVSSCSCLCPIHWSQVLSRWWRCSWSSADRRCSNYIWVIDNFIANLGASYIRDLTVYYYYILIIIIFLWHTSVYELRRSGHEPNLYRAFTDYTSKIITTSPKAQSLKMNLEEIYPWETLSGKLNKEFIKNYTAMRTPGFDWHI